MTAAAGEERKPASEEQERLWEGEAESNGIAVFRRFAGGDEQTFGSTDPSGTREDIAAEVCQISLCRVKAQSVAGNLL